MERKQRVWKIIFTFKTLFTQDNSMIHLRSNQFSKIFSLTLSNYLSYVRYWESTCECTKGRDCREKRLRFATGYTERSERSPHASVRIVELLKRRSCGISIQGWGITQHVHMRSCGWMMWRRIVWRIRADRRSRDQWFAGTRWFQTTGPGAATTCRPYIHPQILAQVFSIIVIDTEMCYCARTRIHTHRGVLCKGERNPSHQNVYLLNFLI